MGEGLRHFSKENIQMNNIYEKMLSITNHLEKCKSKPQYIEISPNTVKLATVNKTSAGKDMEKLYLLCIVGGNVK